MRLLPMSLIVGGALFFFAVGTALAGQNPYIRAYVSFTDYPDGNTVPFTGPGVYAPSLYLDQFGWGGTKGIAFAWHTSGFGVPLDPVYPSGGVTYVGGPDEDQWIILWPECTYPTSCGFLQVVTQPYYVTGPGTITLTGGIFDGKAVVDCASALDYFCVAAHAGIGGDAPEPDDECILWYPRTVVACEPQGGDNPSHPPTYWYDVVVGSFEGIWRFAVQTFDPDTTHYSNWVDPTGWVHGIEAVGGETWVVWARPDHQDVWSCYRFQFDNPNPPVWGDWIASDSGDYQSSSFADCRDGYGYRVHVPSAYTPVRETSWGAVKALYR